MPSSEPPNGRWLLRSVTVDGQRRDCRVRDGRIVELAPILPVHDGEQLVHGAGGELLPGLCDHHVHLRAVAAARRSVDLRGGGLADLPPLEPGPGWLRVV